MQGLSTIWKTLSGAIDPCLHLEKLGEKPYPWQEELLLNEGLRSILLTGRQSGKSTTIAEKVENIVKYEPGSLAVIITDTLKHSRETLRKVTDILALDKKLKLEVDNQFEKEFSNGSRILALPGTERSVRGFSAPRIIVIDEAARVFDETYSAARPMMVGSQCELVLATTAFGQRGFFYNIWNNHSPKWKKILVVPAWRAENHKLVSVGDEEELKEVYAEQGISFHFSPRHDRDFMEEELEAYVQSGGGDMWFNQEYGCDFLSTVGSLFNYDDLMAMVSDRVDPILLGDPAQRESEMLQDLEVLEI